MGVRRVALRATGGTGAARISIWFGLLLGLYGVLIPAAAQDEILEPGFDDSPLTEPVRVPQWFKVSFLDIQEDLNDVRGDAKRGLIVYFGQKYCPYCKALLERDFSKPDVEAYTRHKFDVVAVDTHGSRLVTDLDGTVLPENDYAARHEAQFTPTLLFYDANGQEALRLTGYHPVYELRAALEFVADGHFRAQRFRDYLARGQPALRDDGELNQEAFVAPPPHALDRSRIAGQRPLLVMFEQTECHACDVLHVGPLQSGPTRRLLQEFDVAQLDIADSTPVITPRGERTSARDWADQLGLYYTPTLIFYDRHGEEIIRVDSVVHFNRLRSVLRYVLEKGYLTYKNYQDWREHRAEPAAGS